VTPRALGRLFVAYAALAALLCVVVHHAASLSTVSGGPVIESMWRRGHLASQWTATPRDAHQAEALPSGAVAEQVVAEGWVATSIEPVFALSIVAGHDGVSATLDGKTAYVTPDELLSHQAYDKGITVPSLSLSLGTDIQLVLALLADRLGTTVPELRDHATFRRVRTTHVGGTTEGPYVHTKPEDVTPALLRGAAVDIARYLVHGLSGEGRFTYMIDATTGRSLPGYDWPRHAGATFFLAQAADMSGDEDLRAAAVRAASFLRDHATVDCGGLACVGDARFVDLGSAALSLLAMSELARTGIDPSFAPPAAALAKFVRSQQRPDGEFMDFYDRTERKPIDIQLEYYAGEASIALARAHRITGDPADLEASVRALAHLVGPAWSFFGDKYYFGEEHWTCQAMADLWDRAPNLQARDFCARWRAYDARMMYAPGESPFDADGAFGVGPVVTPRLTPVASRTEAGVATLDAMLRGSVDTVDAAQKEALASQLRRSFALLLRQQFRPGASYLFAEPGAVYGAIPGSFVDWQLRIDYAQHAGSAMIRAAELWSSPARL
jgi:hypothetical protein